MFNPYANMSSLRLNKTKWVSKMSRFQIKISAVNKHSKKYYEIKKDFIE